MLLKNLFTFSFLFSFIAFILTNTFTLRILLHSISVYPTHPWVVTAQRLLIVSNPNSHLLAQKLATPQQQPFSSTRVLRGQQQTKQMRISTLLELPSPSWGITLFFFSQCNFASVHCLGVPSSPTTQMWHPLQGPNSPKKSSWGALPMWPSPQLASPWTTVFYAPQWLPL